MTTVVIAFRPETNRGRRILDAFEVRFDLWPMQIVRDGTRRYKIDQGGAGVDGFDSSLDQVDGGWRDHLTTWRET
jgi:hypothetical protein